MIYLNFINNLLIYKMYNIEPMFNLKLGDYYIYRGWVP